MASVLDLVRHYQHAIEKNPNDEQKVLKSIEKLFSLGVTVQHLQETGVGRTVNALRKEAGEVGPAARALVNKWKLMVAAEESDHDSANTENYNGHGNGKDSDDSANQSRSRLNETSYESHRSSKTERSNSQVNGNSSGSKRKYSSEEEENSYKKSRQLSSTENNDQRAVKVKMETESDQDHSEDSHSSESESELSGSSEEDRRDRHKIKKEPVEHQRSSSKHSSHDNEDYKKDTLVSRKTHDSDKHSKSSNSESRQSDKSSSRERSQSSHKHKSSSSKESSSDKNHKSEHSSVEKEKKQTNSSNKHSSADKHSSSRKDSTSSSKHSSSSEKHKSSSHKDKSEKSKSDKHESKSEKHSSQSHKSDKDKHSKSSSEKESSKHKSKESGSSSSSKDKHSSSSKEKSKDRSSSSKEKSSDSSKSEIKSTSHESKSKSKDKPSKSDDKETEKLSSKNKSSHSSTHKSNKSSHHSKEDVPKKKTLTNHSPDSNDGIDCESGASFAEALRMVSPVKPKKKSQSFKEMSSPNTFLNDMSPAALLAPSARLAPLPALEISALPEISPNYRPRPPPRLAPLLTDEDAMSAVISSKNQRTKVYSGNKVIGKIPTLYELCVHVLQEHIDALEFTGGVPYEILKPIVDKATPQQLFTLEYHNPYLTEDTDHLWRAFCEKHFRTKRREEMESWREMYMRCQEEQEDKLKSLTANIKMTTEAKKAPIKQTKMAYVDSVVKPPRNIARKQAQHGTAFAASASPAARVAALASAPNVLRGGVRAPPAPPSSFALGKPKKAPLMAKALQFMRGRKR